jgi:DNA-binding NtrC family response regulator
VFFPGLEGEKREAPMANVLVVDDQACVRDLIAEILVDDGHEVRSVGDAASAMEQVQAPWPEVVLLDLYLDGSQGFDLLRDIKCRHLDLPVIVVTAYDSYRDDPRLSKASGYIVKSVRFWDELREMVTKVLGESTTRPLSPEENYVSPLVLKPLRPGTASIPMARFCTQKT